MTKIIVSDIEWENYDRRTKLPYIIEVDLGQFESAVNDYIKLGEEIGEYLTDEYGHYHHAFSWNVEYN